MIRRALLAAAMLGMTLSMAAEPAYEEQVVTPHWDWEGRHAGGTIRALFLVNDHALRQVDELVQRFDLSAEALPVGGRTQAAMECDRGKWAALMTQRWDVVVLAANTAWAALGETNQSSLIEAMRAGQRVVVFPNQQGTNLNLAALLDPGRSSNRTAEVWRTLPSETLTFRSAFQFREFPCGQGRLFQAGPYDTHWTRFNAFMGQGVYGQHRASWYDEPVTPELFYAVAGRWLRLAAGKEVDPATADGATMEWTLQSPFGDPLAQGTGPRIDPDVLVSQLKPPQAGRLLLRWRTVRGERTVDWGARFLMLTNGVRFLTLGGQQTGAKPLDIEWDLTGGTAPAAVVSVRIYDADGRLVSHAEAKADRGRVAMPGWIPRSPGHEVHVLLREGDFVLDERRLDWVVKPDRREDVKTYHVIAWGTEQGEYTDRFRFERLRQLGVTALATLGRNTNLNRIATARGLRVVPTNILVPPNRHKKTFDKAAEEQGLEDFAKALRILAPLGYSLADEPSGVDPVAFRAFGAEVIRRQDPEARVGYCGVWEGFNRDVPAFFRDCDFAEPYSPFHLYTPNLWMGCERDLYRSFMRPDAIVTCFTHYAPWADHEPYSRTPPWLWMFEGLRGISYFDTGGEFGVLPGDLRLTHETRWWSPEIREIRNGIGEQVLAARRDNGAVRILYSPNAAGAEGWARALNETRVPYRFISLSELEQGIEPEVRALICPQAAMLTDRQVEHVRAFVEKGGLLVATAPFARYRPGEPVREAPVGQANLDERLAEALRDAPAPVKDDGQDPWIRSISVLRQPDPVPAAVDRIEPGFGVRYAAATGSVPKNEMGVSRRGPEARGVPVEAVWSNGAQAVTLTGATLQVYGLAAAGQGRAVAAMRETDRATNATPAEIADARATPAIIEGGAGAGRTVFLAFQPDGPSLRSWIPMLLGGIHRPWVDAALEEGSNDTLYVYRFSDGPIRLVGVVQDYWKVGPAFKVEDRETALHFRHGPGIWSESKAVLTLAEPAHVYDARRGRYLGRVDRQEFPLQPGRPELFACLPYEVKGLELKAPGTARAGDVIEVSVALEGPRGMGMHVIHVELRDLEGEVLEADRYNLHAQGGRGELKLPLAWNAVPGTWTLHARDSLSGKSATADLSVLEGEKGFRFGRAERVTVKPVPLPWPEGRAVPVSAVQ